MRRNNTFTNAPKDQSGFALVVEIIVFVLVLAVLGFIGWTAYSAYNQPNKKTADATSNNTTTSSSKENTSATTTTTLPIYLYIKELGVKVTLDSSISDVTYSMRPSTGDGSTVANISAQSLADKGCSPDTLGLVIESTTQPSYISGPVPIDNKVVFYINNKYYHYVPPQNLGCLSSSQTDINLYLIKLKALQQAFVTLQPYNQ